MHTTIRLYYQGVKKGDEWRRDTPASRNALPKVGFGRPGMAP